MKYEKVKTRITQKEAMEMLARECEPVKGLVFLNEEGKGWEPDVLTGVDYASPFPFRTFNSVYRKCALETVGGPRWEVGDTVEGVDNSCFVWGVVTRGVVIGADQKFAHVKTVGNECIRTQKFAHHRLKLWEPGYGFHTTGERIQPPPDHRILEKGTPLEPGDLCLFNQGVHWGPENSFRIMNGRLAGVHGNKRAYARLMDRKAQPGEVWELGDAIDEGVYLVGEHSSTDLRNGEHTWYTSFSTGGGSRRLATSLGEYLKNTNINLTP
mgnify:CR=1 FL=1